MELVLDYVYKRQFVFDYVYAVFTSNLFTIMYIRVNDLYTLKSLSFLKVSLKVYFIDYFILSYRVLQTYLKNLYIISNFLESYHCVLTYCVNKKVNVNLNTSDKMIYTLLKNYCT
jgi:hypothetical protein